MKILLDLRNIEYGHLGGIENVSYFIIDSLKDKNVALILDVRRSARKFFKNRYGDLPNVKIISDPVEGIIYSLKRIHLSWLIWNLDRILYRKFGWEVFRRRTKWANSITADVVICPSHLEPLQHSSVPAVSFIHAILPHYSNREMKSIESHLRNAKALVSLWRYPYNEFIAKYPEYRDKWHWIPCMLDLNVKQSHKEKVSGVPERYWLYVSFFVGRKNHINLVKAYKLALENDSTLPGLVFVGHGDREYYERLRATVNLLGLSDRVIMNFAFLPHPRVAYLYEHAEAIVSPTLWEAASGTVLEACLAGKPVACSDVPPLRDFADSFGLKMLFFDPQNIVDISGKLQEMNRRLGELREWANQNAARLSKYDRDFFGDSLLEIARAAVLGKVQVKNYVRQIQEGNC